MADATVPLHIKFLRAGGPKTAPAQATPESAGLDLRAALETPSITIEPGRRAPVGTGIAIEIGRPGIAGFVFSRSGLGAKHGLTVAQGVGVIDPDYRGEIIVWLLNTSETPVTVLDGDRIAQLVLMPVSAPVVSIVEDLSDTTRGAGGFGHTGQA